MSYPKNINATFKVENKLQEELIRNKIEYLKPTHIRTFANTDHLKENESFKKLVKAKREAGLILDRFINDNR